MCRAETIFQETPNIPFPLGFKYLIAQFLSKNFMGLWIFLTKPLPCSCLTNLCLLKIINDSLFHKEKSLLWQENVSVGSPCITKGLVSRPGTVAVSNTGLLFLVQGSKLRGLQELVTSANLNYFHLENCHDLLWIYINNLKNCLSSYFCSKDFLSDMVSRCCHSVPLVPINSITNELVHY